MYGITKWSAIELCMHGICSGNRRIHETDNTRNMQTSHVGVEFALPLELEVMVATAGVEPSVKWVS